MREATQKTISTVTVNVIFVIFIQLAGELIAGGVHGNGTAVRSVSRALFSIRTPIRGRFLRDYLIRICISNEPPTLLHR